MTSKGEFCIRCSMPAPVAGTFSILLFTPRQTAAGLGDSLLLMTFTYLRATAFSDGSCEVSHPPPNASMS